MAINSLIYLNQSVPPFGVSLNSIADHSTSFPLSKFYNLTLFCNRPRSIIHTVSEEEKG